jgi:hypothetical protein
VLQNIEFGIISFYRRNPGLNDRAVMRVVEALLDTYNAEALEKKPKPAALGALEQRLLENVCPFCEWRLGRARLADASELDTPIEPISIDEMILCLKRIRKSVKYWHQKEGSQGYLNYVAEFVK